MGGRLESPVRLRAPGHDGYVTVSMASRCVVDHGHLAKAVNSGRKKKVNMYLHVCSMLLTSSYSEGNKEVKASPEVRTATRRQRWDSTLGLRLHGPAVPHGHHPRRGCYCHFGARNQTQGLAPAGQVLYH